MRAVCYVGCCRTLHQYVNGSLVFVLFHSIFDAASQVLFYVSFICAPLFWGVAVKQNKDHAVCCMLYAINVSMQSAKHFTLSYVLTIYMCTALNECSVNLFVTACPALKFMNAEQSFYRALRAIRFNCLSKGVVYSEPNQQNHSRAHFYHIAIIILSYEYISPKVSHITEISLANCSFD